MNKTGTDRFGIVFHANIHQIFSCSHIHASGILPQLLQSVVESNRRCLLLAIAHIPPSGHPEAFTIPNGFLGYT
jgi:hypothetical protein